MSDPVELWFTNGDTGSSVCLYSRMGFVSAEDALFLAMMDGDLNQEDEFIVWTLKKFWFHTGDEDPENYGLSSMPGRSTEQYHIDFKQKLIKRVTMNYQEPDTNKWMTIRKFWTFEDFYNSHRSVALDRPLSILTVRLQP
jgi:hypothetical protein